MGELRAAVVAGKMFDYTLPSAVWLVMSTSALLATVDVLIRGWLLRTSRIADLRVKDINAAYSRIVARRHRLGALRAYYADEDWQGVILEWLKRADLILLVAGTSPLISSHTVWK
jgi:hypothetical protein